MALDPSKFPGFSSNFTPEGASTVYTPPPPDPGLAQSVLNHAENVALPTALSVPGAVAGAGFGSAIGGPVGGVIGGIVGGLGTGAAGGVIQHGLVEANPGVAEAIGIDPATLQAEEQQHPIASAIGEIAPQALAFKPTNLLGLTKDIGLGAKAAIGAHAAFGGALQGGMEAYNEASQGEPLDPLHIGLQAGAGALFGGEPRIGGAAHEIALPGDESLSEDKPNDLLQLTDKRGVQEQQPLLALPSPDQVAPTGQAPSGGGVPFLEGLHPDLLQRNNPDFVNTDQGTVDNTGGSDATRIQQLGGELKPQVQGPGMEPPSPFSVGDIFNKIGTDLEGGAVKGRDKPYALNLATTLANSLRNGDVDGARTFLADQVENLQSSNLGKAAIDKRAAVLAAAHDVVDDFYTRPGQEPAAAPEAAPAPQEPEVAAPPQEPAPAPAMSQEDANALAEQSIAKTSAQLAAVHRQGILDGILSDPTTRNPTGRFIAELRRNGYDRSLSEEEAARIAEHQAGQPGAPQPVQRASGELNTAEFGAQPTELPPVPANEPEAGLTSKAPQKPFEMSSYTEADLARMEAAQNRRAAKAMPHEPEAPEGPETGRLLNPDGTIGADVLRADALRAADQALAQVKGKVARDVVQQAHSMMVAGDAEPQLVQHVAEMTKQGKVAAAKQLLASITNKPEEGPPVTRTVDQVQNIRQAALDHIQANEMGSTKTQHFLAGVDAELGLKNAARPEGPTKQASYDAGRKFAREYQEPEVDEKARILADIQDAAERGEISKGSAKLLTARADSTDPATLRQFLNKTIDTQAARQGVARKLAPQAEPTPKNLSDAFASLSGKLDAMGLHDVSLRVADRMEEFGHGEGTGGFYSRDGLKAVIDVALDSDPVGSLRHEAVHAMKDLGLFKPEEWQLLVDKAMQDRDLVNFAQRYVFDGATTDEALEEAVAELNARWTEGPKGPVGKLLYRMRQFVEALGNALKGKGFQTADDVLRAIDRGEIGSRERFPLAESAVSAAKARKLGLGEVHESAADATTDTFDRLRKFSLNFLAVRQFKHYFTELKEPLEHFWEALSQSGAARADRQFRSAQVVDALNKLAPEERKAVGTLGLDATAAMQDPLEPGNEMSRRLAAMSPEAQAAYKAARNDLARQLEDYKTVQKAIIDQDTEMSPSEKTAAKAKVDQIGRDVYWPMKRFGDLMAVSKTPEYAAAEAKFEAARKALADAHASGADEKTLTKLRGEMGDAREELQQVPDGKVVRAFEKRSKLMEHVKAMKDQGYEVTTMTKPQGGAGGGSDDVQLRAVNKALDRQIADVEAQMKTATGDEAKSLKRSLDTLTGMKSMMAEVHATFSREGSALRAGMRRKGVAGFDEDGIRAYALASRQNAGYVTALEFGTRARKALAEMHDAALKTGDYRHMQVYDQLKRHYDQLGAYASTPLARILTNGAYAYNLAASPSFMAMHLMQTPLVTAPVMGARFGYGKTIAELTKAGAEVVAARAKGHVTPESLGKDAGEVEMVRFLERHGTVSTSDAAGLSEVADAKGAISKASDAVMHVASYLPHHTERFNRLATALADYRLALKDSNLTKLVSDQEFAKAQAEGFKGTKEQLAAAKHAQEVTLDTHVDYGRDNAPAYMQGHGPLGVITKLAFQFQKYQQAMIEYEVRSLKDVFQKGLGDQEGRVALRTLLGVVGSHAIMTGAMGLPGFGAVAFLMDAYHKMLGDQSNPWDAETAFRRYMAEHFGLDMANIIDRGILYTPGIRDVLPADVTDRLGMGDLLTPADRLDGVDREDLVQYIGAALGGPAGGMLGNFLHGFNLMRQGKTERGLEQFMPKVARDLAKTHRYMTEGAETEGGSPIVEAEDLTPADLIAQAAGFTPQKIATAEANKEAIDSAKQQMKERRGILTQRYEHAVTSGDGEAAAAALQAIQAYNDERLSQGLINQAVKPSDLSAAVRQHMLEHILLDQGVALNPKDRPLLEEGIVGS